MRTIARLALLGWLALIPTGAWGDGETPAVPPMDLMHQLLQAPATAVDGILGEHAKEINEDLLGDLVRSGVDKARGGDLAEGQREVKLADYIDSYRKGGKQYAGAGENALTIDLLQQRRFGDAIVVEGDLVLTHPELFRPHFLLGTAYYENGQFPLAVAQLEAAVRVAPDNEESHLELAYAYLRVDRPQDSRQEFQRVIDINPNNGRARDGAAVLDGKLGTDQNAGPANATAAEHFDQAEKLFAARDFEASIREYQQALQADPKLAKAAVYMGDAWLQLGQVDRCVAAYQQAIAINPRDRQAHRFLGDVYEKQYDQSHQGHYLDDAIAEYRKAVQADPSYQTAIDDLARAQAKKNSMR